MAYCAVTHVPVKILPPVNVVTGPVVAREYPGSSVSATAVAPVVAPPAEDLLFANVEDDAA